MNSKLLEKLNPEQKEAVLYNDGPAFVLAGAGTGKTRTLTNKVAYLFYELGVSPSEMLVLTFTNKAAREMMQRVQKLIEKDLIFPYISTFHSFCYRFLKENISSLNRKFTKNFTVADEPDSHNILKAIIKETNYKDQDHKHMYKQISEYKTTNKTYKEIDLEFLKLYEARLEKNNMIDFDNLLLFTKEILEKDENIRTLYNEKFKHILVDEFQDTDYIQYEILKLLANKDKNIFVVGDPDQSIYSFRGACYENNDNFIKDYNPKIFTLWHNYRSVNNILKAANALIKNNESRHKSFTGKVLKSDLGDGNNVIYCTSRSNNAEADEISARIKYILKEDNIKPCEIAVLIRANYLSRIFEFSFTKHKIPYVVYGGTPFFQRKEIKDFVAYLRILLNSKQNFFLKRIINSPKRMIGDKLITKLEEIAISNKVSLYEALSLFKGAEKQRLSSFKKIIEDLKVDLNKITNPSDIIDLIGDKTGYYTNLNEKDKDRADERISNINQLKDMINERKEKHSSLSNESLIEKVLEEIELQTNKELPEKAISEKVVISTYHQVKGLEFHTVFLPAMEENIIPNKIILDLNDDKELEEERRIAYVGITRAKRRLVVSCAAQRERFRFTKNDPSRFIREMQGIDSENLNVLAKPKTHTKKDIVIGTKVWHPKFHEGVVLDISPNNILTIKFNTEKDLKKIAKGFVGLEIINE